MTSVFIPPYKYSSKGKKKCMLDPIQNQALRTCLGAFRTSPVTSLHVEANEMPLDLRRRMLSSEYCLRVSSNVYNPVRSCIFSSKFTKFFDKNPNHVRPLGLRVSGDLSDIGFTQKNNLGVNIYGENKAQASSPYRRPEPSSCTVNLLCTRGFFRLLWIL